ncbi:Bud site selection protein 6 [Termitomyces sp. J132]|nr:hypothetical protein H2248_010444 [Termitomyces sp. 'cryptogamus']KNZ71536.1 Bud site selection protein 6 [Termitomyces sp. J132]
MGPYSHGTYTGRSGGNYSTQTESHAISGPGVKSDVSGSVRSLLLATKRLQELLKQWSTGQATETQISDAYVKIGEDFNTTIKAFAHYQIDLSDIYSVPEELRVPLEQCLVNEPSPGALDMYMPEVRRALYKLYKGIRARKDVWRVAERQMSLCQ